MALPNSRASLIDWCLRELGAPVLEINLDEDQIEDRIDEGLAYFRDYHFDGVEHAYHGHKLTASTIKLASPYTGPARSGEVMVGLTSGCRATLYDISADNLTLRFRRSSETKDKMFVNGEIVALPEQAVNLQLASTNAVFVGDLDNQYVVLPDSIISVYNIISFNTSPANASGMFDVRYQFALNNIHNLLQTDIVSYEMFKSNIALWNFLFNGEKQIHYNRKTDKVHLDVDWMSSLHPDMILLFECWAAIDPEKYREVYADLFVRKYCGALLKRQWGVNLKKFSGISLPGGVTLNGQVIYDEANDEIEKLEKRIEREWTLPINFLIG